jgi:protein ImuB
MAYFKNQRRILALWLPRLPTDRLQRLNSHNNTVPLVVVEKHKNALQVFALDQLAATQGVKQGQPLANVRAMLPQVQVVTAAPHADQKLLQRMADWCDRFTPFVALDGTQGLLLDVTGVAHLFGGEGGLLKNICTRLHAQGFSAQASIAATATAARALARYRAGAVVPHGAEADALSPLPIDALQLDEKTTHAFRRAGLKTIGQAAARKRAEIAARFGAATLTTLDEAMGRQAGKPLSPRRPQPDYWQEKNFAEPVLTHDAITHALTDLTATLANRLAQHGQGARALEARFFRTDGAVRQITIETGAPVRDIKMIMRLFAEKLAALDDKLDPGFGFDLMRLSATRVEPETLHTTELESRDAEARDIAFLVDRLAARFGRQRICAFEPRNTHVPEAAWAIVPAQDATPSTQSWQHHANPAATPRRPLRLFARAEPVTLLQSPSRLSWRRVQRNLQQHEGPERIAMEWWRHVEPQSARDYVRMEDADGHRYWLYRTGAPDNAQWFLHGCFA